MFSALVISTATGLRSTSTVQHATVISAATRLWCSTYEIPLLSTVTTASDPSPARKLDSSTYDTGRRMLRPSTVKYSMDGSATKRGLTSTRRARPSTLHTSSQASTVSHAIDPSAAKRPSGSTCTALVLVCENLVPIGGIRKPLGCLFPLFPNIRLRSFSLTSDAECQLAKTHEVAARGCCVKRGVEILPRSIGKRTAHVVWCRE